MKLSILLAVCITAVYIDSTAAVRCYNCSLAEQHRCAKSVNLPMPHCPLPKIAENMTAEQLKESNIKAVCIKTTKPSRNPNATHPYTRRFCGEFDGKKDNCDELIEHERQETGANLSCYSCEKELCNDSDHVAQKMLIVFASIIVGVYMVVL